MQFKTINMIIKKQYPTMSLTNLKLLKKNIKLKIVLKQYDRWPNPLVFNIESHLIAKYFTKNNIL